MTATTRKRIILIGIGVLVLIVVAYGFRPSSVPVVTETVTRGSLQVVVEEEGETQVRQRYVVSAPTAAYALRIPLESGDPVERGQALVHLEPPRATMLDTRSRSESLARVEAARAALTEAGERARSAAVAAEQAAEERRRTERLFEAGSATRRTLEQAIAEETQTRAAADAARAAVAAAEAELTRARAVLDTDDEEGAVLQVLRSPVTGRILALHKKSAGPVNAGEALLEVGDPDSLEVRVEVLSQDAVRIRPGTRVLIDQWGGDTKLEAIVERIMPQGETEVSSLGVEEKRVPVVAGLTSPPSAWSGLGAGYRVLARFIVWEEDQTLTVPTSALFRTEDGWAVFAVEDGVAAYKQVEIGQQSGLTAQVLGGLTEGDAVIIHPDNSIEDGTRVEPLEEGDASSGA